MARKPQFIPTRTNGTGQYRLYVPGRGVVNLETTDEKEAMTKAHQFQAEYEASKNGRYVAQATPPKPNDVPTAREILQSWASSTQSFPQSPITPLPSPSPLAPVTQPLSPTVAPSAPQGNTAAKVDAVLPADKRSKMAGLVAGVLTRLNVAACALTVSLCGRTPAISDDEESEDLLKEGWKLQLEDVFVEHPPAPWMIILGGSAAVGLGMYMDGTPKPRKQIQPPMSLVVDESGTGESGSGPS